MVWLAYCVVIHLLWFINQFVTSWWTCVFINHHCEIFCYLSRKRYRWISAILPAKTAFLLGWGHFLLSLLHFRLKPVNCKCLLQRAVRVTITISPWNKMGLVLLLSTVKTFLFLKVGQMKDLRDQNLHPVHSQW